MAGRSAYVALVGALLLCSLAKPTLSKKTNIDAVGWSGSALMFVYHTGVLEELVKAGVYKPGHTPTAGTSGGSYIAITSTTGTNASTLTSLTHSMIQLLVTVQQECMAADPNKTAMQCNPAMGALKPYQETLLNEALTNNTKKLAKANNKAYTHLTWMTGDIPYEPYPSTSPDLCSQVAAANKTIRHYNGRQDMIEAMLGSSFYSGVSSPNCAMVFRNITVRDGGYSVHLPCPPKSKHCLMVEATLMPQFRNTTCGLGANEPAFGARDPDIYPGLSGHPLPIDGFCAWQLATVDPQTILQHWDEIYQLARADARAWITANGWA